MPTLRLDTRRLSHVDNHYDEQAATAFDEHLSRQFRQQYLSATHRPTAPCYTYNCHGLTFGARRTQITSAAEVRKILNDDAYVEIEFKDICVGDIIIYVAEDGDIEHSGLIVDIVPDPKVPRVLSKWGGAHEVVHAWRDCPYNNSTRFEFYRIVK